MQPVRATDARQSMEDYRFLYLSGAKQHFKLQEEEFLRRMVILQATGGGLKEQRHNRTTTTG